jgi:hypothetical protein
MPSADDVCASGADLARTWATAVYREVMRAYRRTRREPGLAAP